MVSTGKDILSECGGEGRPLSECKGGDPGPKRYWVTLEGRELPSTEEFEKADGIDYADELPRRVHLACDEETRDELMKLAKQSMWKYESGPVLSRCGGGQTVSEESP